MTYEEFLNACDTVPGAVPPVKLLDGRYGLAPHNTKTHALVDPSPPNADGLAIHIPFDRLRDVGGGALEEIDAPT